MPFHLGRTRGAAGFFTQLRSLWKSEKIRHLACIFEGQLAGETALAWEGCAAHGLPALHQAGRAAPDVLASIAEQAVKAGHEPVIVCNDPRYEFLCAHPQVQLLRLSGRGKNLRLDYLDHEQLHPAAGELATDLDVAFRLEELTPGACVNLAAFYARAGMHREREQLDGLFGEPQSVVQLWS
jgi:hypothetical protein